MAKPAARTKTTAKTVATATTTGTYCKTCGYDLRASCEARRCPECGRAFSPDDPKTCRRRPFAAPWKRALGRWARRGAILLLVLAVLLGGTWGWFYWGWKEEQAALARMGPTADYWESDGASYQTRPWGFEWAPALQRWCGPLGYVLDRVYYIQLPFSATDADMARLGELRDLHALRGLALPQTQVTDAGLVYLRELPRLSDLDVASLPITDASLARIGELRHLRRLNLDETAVTGAGLAHLEKCTKLGVLSLVGTSVGDAGMNHVGTLKELSGLDLVNTPVTDAGLEPLATCAHLGWLTLHGTKVSPAGVARLKAARPKCMIVGP